MVIFISSFGKEFQHIKNYFAVMRAVFFTPATKEVLCNLKKLYISFCFCISAIAVFIKKKFNFAKIFPFGNVGNTKNFTINIDGAKFYFTIENEVELIGNITLKEYIIVFLLYMNDGLSTNETFLKFSVIQIMENRQVFDLHISTSFLL